MNNNIEKLKEKFKIIKEKGWIKSISNSTGSVGTTFEYLLGNKENCSTLPDYYGIELKCSTNTSSSPVTLFSITFDGPNPYELLRLANTYGYPDKIFNSQNIIYASLSCNKSYLVNNKYYFKLEIDKFNQKLYLVIMNINYKILEKKCYITFNTLKKHLYTKFKYLAIINAFKKYINGEKYFKYYNLLLYQLKDFNTFVNLIEKDIIKINMILRISKSKLHYGKPSYKNIIFSINKYNLQYLFKKIDKYMSL